MRRYIGHCTENGERRSVYERETPDGKVIEVYRGFRFVAVPKLPATFQPAEPRPHAETWT